MNRDVLLPNAKLQPRNEAVGDGEELPTKRMRLPAEWDQQPPPAPQTSNEKASNIAGDSTGSLLGSAATDPALAPCAHLAPSLTNESAIRAAKTMVDAASGPVIVMDLETTGFGNDSRIIQIGAVEVRDLALTGIQFQSLVHCGGSSIHPKAASCNGLSVEMLRDAPQLSTVMANFLRFCASCQANLDGEGEGEAVTIVCHNAVFDVPKMLQAFAECDLKAPFTADGTVCTMKVFREAYPSQASSASLDAVGRFFGVTPPQHGRHTALVDATITAEVFIRMTTAFADLC